MSSALKFSSQSNPKSQLGNVEGWKGRSVGPASPAIGARDLHQALISSKMPVSSVMDGEQHHGWRDCSGGGCLCSGTQGWGSQRYSWSCHHVYACLLATLVTYHQGKPVPQFPHLLKVSMEQVPPPHLLRSLNQNHVSGMKRNNLTALANYISMLFSHCLQQPGNHFVCYHIFAVLVSALGAPPHF